MTVSAQCRKLFWLALLLGGALAALGFRLVDLQVVQHDRFQQLAEGNTVRKITRVGMRGQILDRRGIPLATSQPAKILCADPTLIGDRREQVAAVLAPLLQTDAAHLAQRLAARARQEGGKTKACKYVVLQRKVPVETWEKIKARMAQFEATADESKLTAQQRAFLRHLRAKAVFAEDDEIRVYPYERLAAHVLGYVSGDAEEAGLTGIEQAFDSSLRAVSGWRVTEMDNRQRELVAYRDEDVAPRDGANVVLTLDAGLQDIVESELAAGVAAHQPISASGIMVCPRTGEILALATLPNFDPNHPGASPMEALRNRVISDIAEPGSTFKIVVVSAGLNERAVTLSDIFDCENGQFCYAGRTLHDHKSYGLLSVENIITKSSNIGAAKIGIRLGEERLYQYIHNFGFGQRTGIPLPDEAAGLVHPLSAWTKVSIAQIPMGQGIAVTPLQMVLAMAAIANHGLLMRPMLVSRLEDVSGKVLAQYTPQSVRRLAGPEAMRDMVKALKTVVTREGTAAPGRLDHYTVAGKTGTAQKVEHGQYVEKFFSSFVGFFPADDPELCILVVMDEPKDSHYGGEVAAPVFHAIAERAANYLNLKPDSDLPPPASQTLTVAQDAGPGGDRHKNY